MERTVKTGPLTNWKNVNVNLNVNVAIERTNIHVLFAVGSDISILRAPMAAAISPFMSPLNPPNP